MAKLEEGVGLLGQGSKAGRGEVLDEVRLYRTDCRSRLADFPKDLAAELSAAAAQVRSDPMVEPVALLAGRLRFFCNSASNGWVAASLIRGGNSTWGGCVIGLMVLPYVLMAVALFSKATQKMSKQLPLPRWMAALAWLLVGAPACVGADLYLHLRYAWCDPELAELFHYFTTRSMAEMVEAYGQLALQGYFLFRVLDPGHLLPAVQGCNPWLLAFSIGMSMYAAFAALSRLRRYSRNQTGGSMGRFLWCMSRLGEGLVPSDLFERLQSMQRVLIPCDLGGVPLEEMRRLASAAKRSRHLEELVFLEGAWLSAAGASSSGATAGAVRGVVEDFARAPNLRFLDFRSSEEIPNFAAEAVQGVAQCHRFLQEVHLQGYDPIVGSFVNGLEGAHPLVQAAHSGDRAAVEASGASSRPGGEAPEAALSDALALAASRNARELLRALLLHPGGLEAVNLPGAAEGGLFRAGDGARPLHFAAAANSADAVKLLLIARGAAERGASGGLTPLHAAALSDASEALQALLEGRAEVARATRPRGATALLLAAEQDSVASVRRLLAARAEVDKADRDGATPAFLAAERGHSGALQLLLDAKGDVNIPRSTDGSSPLSAAAARGNAMGLELLLRARASVNQEDHGGATPAHAAALAGRLDCLGPLLRARADVLQPDRKGASPLFVAAARDHVACVEALLAARADVRRALYGAGTSPLCAAARESSLGSLQALLRAAADVHQAEAGGATPLLMAAEESNVDCLQALLDARADVHHKKKDGENAILTVAFKGHEACLWPLLRARADPRVSLGGRTAVLWALHEGHQRLAAALEAFLEEAGPRWDRRASTGSRASSGTGPTSWGRRVSAGSLGSSGDDRP